MTYRILHIRIRGRIHGRTRGRSSHIRAQHQRTSCRSSRGGRIRILHIRTHGRTRGRSIRSRARRQRTSCRSIRSRVRNRRRGIRI